MDLHLQDKVAVITGGAAGIGAAAAKQFADLGAIVYVTYLSNGAAANRLCESREDQRIRAIQLDVTSADSVAHAFQEIKDLAGPVQILVNNAVPPNWANYNIWEPDIEQYQQMQNTVLTGSLYTVKAVLPDMRERGWGRIINVSSSVGFFGRAGASHYGAVKAGLVGWTKNVAKEIGRHGILINAVVPGLVETERAHEFLKEDYRKDMAAKNPMGRNAKPEDIANVITFLASRANTFINGAAVPVDGGMF